MYLGTDVRIFGKIGNYGMLEGFNVIKIMENTHNNGRTKVRHSE